MVFNKNNYVGFFSLFTLLFTNILFSQNSLIKVDEINKDIGSIQNIYKVKTDFIITNNQIKNLYLLRADAENGITIQTSKKTIKPNDTTLLVIEFIPQKTGKFTKSINLITSANDIPFKINFSGTILSIKSDDKTACFYFKKQTRPVAKTNEEIVLTQTQNSRENSNKEIENRESKNQKEVVNQKEEIQLNQSKSTLLKDENQLDEKHYKPNNIIFLVDVSSSMKDTSKLKVMQYALHYLIDFLRASDKITFITYADSVKTIRNGVSGDNKKDLHEVVDLLKAKGITKGKKAVLYSLDVALKNYIINGNNQIILATDGKFRFDEKDQDSYLLKQANQQVKLTCIAVGNDKDAMKNLKEISEIGKGNFIHLKNKSKAKQQLLEEVKQNSLIK